MPVSTKVYSDLLETLYAATLDESQWHAFLSQLCEATQSILALLLRNDSTLGSRLLAFGGLPADPASIPEGEGYSTVDPVREAFMRSPRTGIIEVEDFLPHEELVRHAYYPRMAALGAAYGTCIVPCISVRRYDLISLWRGVERPRLAPERRDLLTMLFPHIQCALRIHQTLGVAEERARNAEALLDANPTASLVLSEAGKLLYMNAAAQKLVERQEGLSERDGWLTLTQPAGRHEFTTLLAAASGGARPSGGAMTLYRAGDRRALQLLVSPLRSRSAERSSGRILILVTDPDQTGQFPDTILRRLYGFTTAETEVANGMLTGFSIDEIAAIRKVSVGTARSQLKSMLSKTGTRRQVDLVRLLTTLPKLASPDGTEPVPHEPSSAKKRAAYRI